MRQAASVGSDSHPDQLLLQEKYPQLATLMKDMDSFHKFVQIRLRAFGLLGRYNPEEVINECLLRWFKAVEGGKTIPVLDGWMRLTAQNIIREWKRGSDKSVLCDPTVLTDVVPDEHNSNEDDNQQQKQLALKALRSLSAEKQELLEMRIFQNLSWSQIVAKYTERGERLSEQAARKRGQRAVEDLREAFLEMLRD